MSGTSADGVDAALLFTDGQTLAQAGESLFVAYDDALRADILALMRGVGDAEKIAQSITDVHIQAVNQLIKKANVSRETIALVGFHGQTIRHAPHEGITVQIGDAGRMARELGIPVVADFRTNDVRHGGQGAPLVPLYHAALVEKLAKPVMVVNIGGVANVTWIGESRIQNSEFRKDNNLTELRPLTTELSLLAFDCGPGNALLDDWVHAHTGARYDAGGALAAQGVVDESALAQFLADPFFAQPAPKSLDRLHFKPAITGTAENGAATLTAMTAAAIARACALVPQRPRELLITGGGRHNPTLMRMIEQQCQCPVVNVDSLHWNGDMLEAEAFAYLAARSVQGLPLSLPTTTGVKATCTGGVLFPVEA